MIHLKTVWLRADSGGQWRKIVVDVMVISSEEMRKGFKEKDDKYRERTTRETQEKRVMTAVMVPLVVSHDGAMHRDTVR